MCSVSEIIANGGPISSRTPSCVSDHIVGEIELYCGYRCEATPYTPPPPVSGTWVLNSRYGGMMTQLAPYCSASVVAIPPAGACTVGDTAPYTQNSYGLWCNASFANYSWWQCQ
jgi:hypothetical protein